MSPTPLRAGFTRRDGLRALALLAPAGLLAACTGTSDPASGSAAAAPSGSTAVGDLAAQVAAQESALIAQYQSAMSALEATDPDVIAVLTDIRDQHAAHRDALGGSDDAPAPAALPVGRAAALGALVAAEREASRDRIRSCVAADDAELARVLALIGASEAAHVPALRDLRS